MTSNRRWLMDLELWISFHSLATKYVCQMLAGVGRHRVRPRPFRDGGEVAVDKHPARPFPVHEEDVYSALGPHEIYHLEYLDRKYSRL